MGPYFYQDSLLPIRDDLKNQEISVCIPDPPLPGECISSIQGQWTTMNGLFSLSLGYIGYAQDFLARCAGVTPGWLMGPERVLEIEPESAVCRAKHLPIVQLLQLLPSPGK